MPSRFIICRHGDQHLFSPRNRNTKQENKRFPSKWKTGSVTLPNDFNCLHNLLRNVCQLLLSFKPRTGKYDYALMFMCIYMNRTVRQLKGTSDGFLSVCFIHIFKTIYSTNASTWLIIFDIHLYKLVLSFRICRSFISPPTGYNLRQ